LVAVVSENFDILTCLVVDERRSVDARRSRGSKTEPSAAVWTATPEQRRILLIFALLLNGQQPIRRYAVDLLQTAIWPRQLNAIDARFISQAEIDAIVS
jgi:hypothetical protein